MRSLLLLAVFASLGSGCAIGLGKSLHQFSVLSRDTVSSSYQRVPIEAEESEHVILGFIGNTDYVDRAYAKLLAACPDGEIVNVVARYSTDLGILAYREKIVMRGECVTAPK